MTKCEDCLHKGANGCTLLWLMPPPRFEDGECTHFEGEKDGEYIHRKGKIKNL